MGDRLRGLEEQNRPSHIVWEVLVTCDSQKFPTRMTDVHVLHLTESLSQAIHTCTIEWGKYLNTIYTKIRRLKFFKFCTDYGNRPNFSQRCIKTHNILIIKCCAFSE